MQIKSAVPTFFPDHHFEDMGGLDFIPNMCIYSIYSIPGKPSCCRHHGNTSEESQDRLEAEISFWDGLGRFTHLFLDCKPPFLQIPQTNIHSIPNDPKISKNKVRDANLV